MYPRSSANIRGGVEKDMYGFIYEETVGDFARLGFVCAKGKDGGADGTGGDS
jgi:hypothetical protein